MIRRIKDTTGRFRGLPIVNIKVDTHDEMMFLWGTVDAGNSQTRRAAETIIAKLQSALGEFLQNFSRSDFTVITQ